ncbi:iron-containing alcohol dehydrogenase [Xanthobacteraceae bacterium A53D]
MSAFDLSFDGVAIPTAIRHARPDRIAEAISALEPDRLLVLSDDRVLDACGGALLPLLRNLCPVHVISGPDGEGLKSLAYMSACLEDALAWGVTRRTVVVGFGGGVVGNLAGLIAALLFRGLRLVQVPTTLLAMHDSVLSLKQAVNSAVGKNLIGTYYVPQAILIDTGFLDTLPLREWRSGLAEAIKNALTLDPGMIPRLRAMLSPSLALSAEDRLWLLETCLDAKCRIMAEDRCEKKAAIVLEYGHTVGHAVELAAAHNRAVETISHGEAVGLGMLAAARIATAHHGLPAQDADLHRDLLARMDARLELPRDLPTSEVMALVARDNKRGYIRLRDNQAAMVLLNGIGRVAGDPALPLVPTDLAEIAQSLPRPATPARRASRPVPIDVYMVTHGRRASGPAAVASVLGQSYAGPITLWLLEDGGERARDWFTPAALPPDRSVVHQRMGAAVGHPLARVGHLRNRALGLGTAPLVAFIDDDNLWEPDHLASLAADLKRSGAAAAHSWRQLSDGSGRPTVPQRFHWRHPDDPMGGHLLDIYRRTGVFSAHDAVVRDRVSLPHEGTDLGMVDMGEWLLRRSIFDDFRFAEDYTADEIAAMVGEDDKLLSHLRMKGIATVCTERATLHYRLGGFSNDWT